MKINIDKIISNDSIKNTDAKIETLLERSLRKYGQIYPILVNDKFEIIKGNTIFKILKRMEIKEVYVNVIDCENENQLYLELNLLKGEPNPIKCFELMKDVDSNNCLPYTSQQVTEFVKLLEFDWAQYKKQSNSISDLF